MAKQRASKFCRLARSNEAQGGLGEKRIAGSGSVSDDVPAPIIVAN